MQERHFAIASGFHRHLLDAIPLRLSRRKKTNASCSSISPPSYRAPLLLFFLLLIGGFAFSRWIIASKLSSNTTTALNLTIGSTVAEIGQTSPATINPLSSRPPSRSPLICSEDDYRAGQFNCSTLSPPLSFTIPSGPTNQKPSSSCPAYFRWIHEDLRPWKVTGITKEMVERARKTASFRLVILRGRAYIERYRKSFQTRDVFTIWGVLQLLRRYPGRVPDLDLMFDCVDWPVVRKSKYSARKNRSAPPPLFRYCGDDSTLDIVFPDWSFWGWPEINIKPWEALMKEIMEGNQRIKWMNREPHAYWKGNPAVAETRQDLLRCNVSAAHDWNARIFAQDWQRESRRGFEQSKLARQCEHRYKIYIEGSAWSVSEKYILACDSLTLLVKPRYYDFFSRGLFPVQHYWPVRDDDKCRSIEFAVRWGNSHKHKAQEIGRASSRLIAEQLKMGDVYDYMLHLLTEYANLLRFQPTKPPLAAEYCPELMACNSTGLERAFMEESMVNAPSEAEPCVLTPPFGPGELEQLARRKADATRQVEIWEAKSRVNG